MTGHWLFAARLEKYTRGVGRSETLGTYVPTPTAGSSSQGYPPVIRLFDGPRRYRTVSICLVNGRRVVGWLLRITVKIAPVVVWIIAVLPLPILIAVLPPIAFQLHSPLGL